LLNGYNFLTNFIFFLFFLLKKKILKKKINKIKKFFKKKKKKKRKINADPNLIYFVNGRNEHMFRCSYVFYIRKINDYSTFSSLGKYIL